MSYVSGRWPLAWHVAAACALANVYDILEAYGYCVPDGAMMPCPIDKDRSCSFWVTHHHFRCGRCRAEGNAVDLERELGGGSTADAIRRIAFRRGLLPNPTWLARAYAVFAAGRLKAVRSESLFEWRLTSGHPTDPRRRVRGGR